MLSLRAGTTAPSRTVGARTDQIEPVLAGPEADLARRLLDGGLDRPFDALRRREILDPPAVGAHQMVMVPGEILGQFVARRTRRG